MTKVVSVIVTYNGSLWINRCLHALLENRLDHHIIVVDNLSKDGTRELVATTFPQVELIANPMNLGFGKANNIGIKAAIKHQPEYVFLLNQDVYVEPTTLESLVEIASQGDQYGIVSPVHTGPDEKTLDCGFRLHLEKSGVDTGSMAFSTHSKELFQVNFVNAAAWLMPLSALSKVGGFDPIFVHYGEDDQLASRMHFHGYQIVVFTGARVIHDRRQSVSQSAFDAQVEYRNYLARATDLASAFHPEYVRTVKKWLINFFKALGQLKLRQAFIIAKMTIKISLERGKIKRTRKMTSNPPYPYLYIDVG